jgi:hypothetical protein
MNYIARLQGELAELQEQLQAKDEAVAGIGSQCATLMLACWRSSQPAPDTRDVLTRRGHSH